MPPLPPGPPPPYDSYRDIDWRVQRPQHGLYPSAGFTFENNDGAPQYPLEQDYGGNIWSGRNATQEKSRLRSRDQHRDNRNLNRPRRGQNFHRGRGNYGNHVAPSDRPLLQQRNETGFEELLGMTEEQARIRRYLPAEDVSDSEEEPMEESGSDVDVAEQNGRGSLEPPRKRRTIESDKRQATDANSEPKWSNPDPYTVLPPVDEETRKRKDVVKLIRKSDLRTAVKSLQQNQVAANDDFISFGFEDDKASIRDRASRSPSSSEQDDRRLGEHRAPSVHGQRFSHLENLHGQASGAAPGTYNKVETANSLGPPPTLFPTDPIVAEEIVVDTQFSRGALSQDNSRGNYYDDGVLGNRKRTHNDEIKGEKVRSRKKDGFGQANGSVLNEWVAGQKTDPLPWLRRSDTITKNSGFRSVASESSLEKSNRFI